MTVMDPVEDVSDATRHFGDMNRIKNVVVTSAKRVEGAPEMASKVKNVYETWEIALDRVAGIVDVVDKIAEVASIPFITSNRTLTKLQIHPYAKMAWSILSFIPKASPL